MIEEQLEANQQPEPGVDATPETAIPKPCEIISPSQILSADDKTQDALHMSDTELLAKVEGIFHNWRDNIPYLREARDRFAQPGRRLPLPNKPTWSEWVQEHLGVGIRRVQQLLAETKPKSTSSKPPAKPFALPGLSETEFNAIVDRAKTIGPETASRVIYNALVFKSGELEPVRAAVKHCLTGVSGQRQLELLQELQKWVGSQMEDLTEELNKPPKKRVTFMDDEQEISPAEPGTLLADFEQRNAVATWA